MIISASRRTDIPAFYSDWFFKRIKEGFVLVRNPRQFRQVSRVLLTPDIVDLIVFWTKNPTPMIKRLDELRDYMYYFQFTITPYGKDVEPNVPVKNPDILATFKEVSKIAGSDRVIWRYDPILLNEKYTASYHIRAFAKMAKELNRYTDKVIISFVITSYRGLKGNAKTLSLSDFPDKMKRELAASLASIAHEHGLTIDICAEKMDLQEFGIGKACCVDDRLLTKNIKKDKNQRQECGCVSSIDIGMYNSCLNGCLYCYANYSKGQVPGNNAKHNPSSPLLFSEVSFDDKITERAAKTHSSQIHSKADDPVRF